MRTIKEILTDISDLYLKHIMINSNALNICQYLGYNGLKRWHRIKFKKFNDLFLKINCKSFDFYGVEIKTENVKIVYEPTTIIIHISNYLDILKEDFDKLGKLNKEFFELTGFDAPKTCIVKKEFSRSIEKCKRILNRYQEIGNHSIAIADLHYFDDKLHKKCKKIEEEYYSYDYKHDKK